MNYRKFDYKAAMQKILKEHEKKIKQQRRNPRTAFVEEEEEG